MLKTRWLPSLTPAILVALVMCASTLSATEWKEKVLYSFQGTPDGAVPAGGVVFDKAGNLYGATQDGGSSSCDGPGQCGTVYQLTPPTQKGGAWTETVLYVFKGHAQNDGATPEGGLVIDQAGNLYGTTGYGGSGPCLLLGGAVGCGTVYELSPPAKQGDPWTETVLYSFQGGKDGYVASGDLVFDKAGNLYGATLFGGGKGTTCDSLYGGQCGTIFKVTPPKTKGGKWTEKVLHRFGGIAMGKLYGDGAEPNGGLVFDSKGAIYGTTYIGGYNCPQFQGAGCGTVFELKPPTKTGSAWTDKILHRFTEGSDGGNPNVGLIFDTRAALYGTTAAGGTQDSGVVFRFTQANGRWAETVLHSFQGTKDQSDPQGLVFDSLGNLYCSSGSIVRLKSPTRRGGKWVLTVLYEFNGPPDGRSPTDLTFGKGTALYGTTLNGGTGRHAKAAAGPCLRSRHSKLTVNLRYQALHSSLQRKAMMSVMGIYRQSRWGRTGLEWRLRRRAMKRIAMLALMFAILSGSALCQYSAEFSRYYSGKRYDFRIIPEQLSSTPAWLDGEPNPPLSARAAKDIAAVYLSDLFKNTSVWRAGEIALYPVAERWVYLISFDPPLPPGCYDCMSTPFKIVVLMNGVAVPAAKSQWSAPAPSQR